MATQINKLLKLLPHKLKVTFAVYCANDVKHLMNKQSVYCLELTEKWLKDSTSVSNDELRNAADVADASNIASAVGYATAAEAAASAAYAASAAANADDAIYAANTAYTAANTAYAATASSYIAGIAARETKRKYYYNHLISMINNLSTFEKIMWGLYDQV